MKLNFTCLLALILIISSPLNLLCLAQQREQKVVVGTNEVQLDVVVKDKKGRPVKDLKPGDFEVFEDGVKQPIE